MQKDEFESHLKAILKVEDLHDSQSLEDLDSLDKVELLVIAESYSQRLMKYEDVAKLKTLVELMEFIR